MLKVSDTVSIPLNEIRMTAVRSPGPGGQNVNKVATAIHLKFNINASSLSPVYKERLLKLKDRRITTGGDIVIKARTYRSREKNREDALKRLKQMITSVLHSPKKRKPSMPSRKARQKRMDWKTKHGRLKSTRKKIAF